MPDKDDITNAYAAAYNLNGDLVVYFGLDRYANNGDAQTGFWFFQQDITLNPNGSFNGTHTVGDILVLAEFTNGGREVRVQVLEWVASGGDVKGGTLRVLLSDTAAPCGSGTADFCAITNADPEASPWPYTPEAGPSGTFPTFSFFEGGVNVTKLFARAGQAAPPCFASFMAETRSSHEVDSQLKDFSLHSFPVCKIEIAKQCPSGGISPSGESFTYNFNGTVKNGGLGTLYDVTVIDTFPAGTTPPSQTFNIGTLGPAGSADFSGTFTSKLSGPDNNARVEAALTPGGPKTLSAVAAPAPCPAPALNPAINVTKICATDLKVTNNMVVVEVGFQGQVCNTSNVKLTGVTVTDDKSPQTFALGDLEPATASGPTCKPYGPGSYLPNTITPANLGRVTFTDQVTATGTPALGGAPVSAKASATCPLCPPGSCPP